MPGPSFKHPSWDSTWWSLWGYLYTGRKADNELQNDIRQLHAEISAGLPKVASWPKNTPEYAIVAGWRRRIEALDDDHPIGYDEADGLYWELRQMLADLRSMAFTKAEADRARSIAQREAERQQQEAERQLAATMKAEAKAKARAEAKGEKLDSADYLLTPVAPRHDHHRVAATKPKPTPPSPAFDPAVEAWKTARRDMANECDEVQTMLNPKSRRAETFGAHAVTQASVLNYLPNIEGAAFYQGRPGPQNSHKRVIVAIVGVDIVAAFWTNGLSHHEERVRGNVVVYERDGGSSRFTHVPPSRTHPKHV